MAIQNKKVKNYEVMVALKPLLPDDVRKEFHKTFVEWIESEGGTLTDVDVWGKRYLSYNINGHNEGYYIVYNFNLLPKSIAELRRQFELKQDILRYIVVEEDHPEDIGKKIKKKEINL